MHCGLVPLLRSLWGAVRNRKLFILRVYCKSCISFNFSIFSLIYMIYRQKNITRIYRKKNNSNFFFIICMTYRKKKIHAFTAKKIHDLTIFFVCESHFAHLALGFIKPENRITLYFATAPLPLWSKRKNILCKEGSNGSPHIWSVGARL